MLKEKFKWFIGSTAPIIAIGWFLCIIYYFSVMSYFLFKFIIGLI